MRKERYPLIKLKEQRKKMRYTRKGLAELLGCAPHTIYQYETGMRSPDIVTLAKIAKIFGCGIADLI